MAGPELAETRLDLTFPDVEAAYLRAEALPSFAWVENPAPSPRVRLRGPLSNARVGLVSTAGAHLREDRPLGAGGGVRRILVGSAVTFTHPGFDTERSLGDPEVVYPDAAVRELADEGVIRSHAGTVLSTMGGALIGQRVIDRGVPEAVAWAIDEQLDLALLVPA